MGVFRRLLVAAVIGVVLASVTGHLTARAADGAKTERVLLAGDSLTYQYGAKGVKALEGKGFVTTARGYPGYGLLDDTRRLVPGDPTMADVIVGEASAWDADIVVLEFVGNYGIVSPPLPGVAPGTPAFFDAWAKQAATLTARLNDLKAEVYWVRNPRMRDARFDGSSQGLSRVYDLLADHAGAHVVDAAEALGGGRFDPSYRKADGVHLNARGEERLATVVADRLARDAGLRLRPLFPSPGTWFAVLALLAAARAGRRVSGTGPQMGGGRSRVARKTLATTSGRPPV